MTHPDSEVLAEFRAGLVTGRRGARISAHLDTCEHCAGVCDQLAEIAALLATVPAPAMPDAVVQRLGDVLAAEAAGRHDPERAVGDGSPDRATRPPPRRRRDFRPVALRVLAPAAAAIALAAGGYGLSRIGGGPAGSVASGSVAAPAATSAQAAPAVMPPSGPASRPAVVPAIRVPFGFKVVTSQTDYERATLQGQLERELRRYGRAAGTAQEAGSLEGCVLRVTGGTSRTTLALVEKARFQGQPAIVIVVAGGRHDTAWVTTSSCSASSDHVLATTTLPGTSAP